MKDLIIIGAGGMGRTMYDLARESLGYGIEFQIKGFIDDNISALNGFIGYPPIVGTISAYCPEANDVFACSIGGHARRRCMESLINRGAEFISLIHETARIGSNVKIGKGNLVGSFTIVAADAIIGDYNFIQSMTIIGHDVVVGNWNRIDSQVMMVGGIILGNYNMVHTGAMINHNVHIGNDCTIGACSFVTMDVENGSTLFSTPARRLK